jgi:serine protease Do
MKRLLLMLAVPLAAGCGEDLTPRHVVPKSAQVEQAQQPAPVAQAPERSEPQASASTGPSAAAQAPLAQAPAASPGGSATAGATRPSGLPDFTALVKNQGPAVVNIITKRRQQSARAGGAPGATPGDDALSEFLRRFVPDAPPRGGPSGGLGSGFFISEDGYILTNAHVVAEADEVTVRLAEQKREFKAKVVGADERTDIALLKVDASGLPAVKMGSSEKLQAGDWVAAIGSPFGFENTITAGIVSAKGRSLPSESFVPFIQTDVAVNPGNSGGPLLNLDGEVVGVNSMIYSQTGGFMGLSFAIPIEVALDVGKQLQATGKVTRGRIGVAIQPLTKELAKSFGLDEPVGALVSRVDPGGPAQKAGLQTGDVILEYNGDKIDDPNKLPRVVAATKPGQESTLTVWRNGKKQTLKVVTGEMPSEKVASAESRPGKPSAQKPNRLGLVVSELPPAQRQALGVDYGLIVQSVEGAPERAQIRPGDVIVAVNRQRFKSLEEFEKLLSAQKNGDTVALLVQRGEATLFIPMEIG